MDFIIIFIDGEVNEGLLQVGASVSLLFICLSSLASDDRQDHSDYDSTLMSLLIHCNIYSFTVVQDLQEREHGMLTYIVIFHTFYFRETLWD